MLEILAENFIPRNMSDVRVLGLLINILVLIVLLESERRKKRYFRRFFKVFASLLVFCLLNSFATWFMWGMFAVCLIVFMCSPVYKLGNRILVSGFYILATLISIGVI